MPQINSTMMQYFHWYIDPDLILWNDVKNKAQELADAGFTALWLPPAYKGIAGGYDVGYGVYDMYDLGEFDQKGTIRTKYGDRQQYLDAIQALQKQGLQVYADTVLNHRLGGDESEVAKATPFSDHNRLHPKGEPQDIKAYTHYTFPGRQGKHSDFQWHWWHFDAVDYDDNSQEQNTIYLFDGKKFDDYVALEKGNFAYLMGCDVDFQSQEVREEITRWGEWYLDTTGVDGFRIDAVKHISAWFFPQWLDQLKEYVGKDLFAVGEYWEDDITSLHWYLDTVENKMSLIDVPLHFNFHRASKSGGDYDMRTILDGTLMQERPTQAVTFVENHDSQPLQALESPVEPWFKPLAYALILLRGEGYPCVFYADYYGAEYEDKGRDGNDYKIVIPSHRELIDKFLYARQNLAYGPQYDYFDDQNVIGWTRLGDTEHPKGLAVVMSNGSGGSKWMEVGKPNAKFYDLTEQIQEPVYTNEEGWADFCCNDGSVSVWIQD
ncbi:alpha-amylase [Trichormus variabilis]|uniref:Alpha-amylase n=1 Tax=Trichormus variabilis SAG 1403-4b TaxID=447716 RepID=A0A433UWI7_ANAVA|nr:alpha-amylase [Trichormus variabilis]MBD2626206.1 alpha-amylase [Trichormus variabilis FACHB-164]RUS98176.1 alpha-amylase [Trichormus variabilis SAG 1403-4b]